MSVVKLSEVVSMELDGVPPRAIRVEFACEDGTLLTIAMPAHLAARLEAGLLRIPLPGRQDIAPPLAMAS